MDWSTYLKQNKSKFIQELMDFISIPSVSALEEHFDDVSKAGNWVVKRLISAGISNAQLLPTETHPVVFADWLHAGEDKPTILIYGHFDVQPVDPLERVDSDEDVAHISVDLVGSEARACVLEHRR